MKSASLTTSTQREQFNDDGYVVIEGLLDLEDLDLWHQAVTRAVHRRVAADDRELAERSLYEQSFRQCINLWEDSEAVRTLTFHQKIGQVAAELLNVPALRLFHDQALYKEPGGRETDPHQDQPYWPIEETDTITAWIPFLGSTMENGCMGFVPGSHRLGIRKFVNIFRAGKEDLTAAAKEIMVADPVYIEVPRGAVSFHHGLVAHDAKPNVTEVERPVHTMIYFANGSHRTLKGQHPILDRLPVAPGAVIDGPATPVAWPRNDLPTPPPTLVNIPETFRQTGVFPDYPDTTGD